LGGLQAVCPQALRPSLPHQLPGSPPSAPGGTWSASCHTLKPLLGLGSLTKRRELSAAPSAVCPPAGGRDTWIPPAPDASHPPPEPPPAPGLPSSPALPPQTPLCRPDINKTCCSRAFTTSASSLSLLRPGMATPTQAPTKVPQEPDPFHYDYDTVQTVGMTLATILFLLGILIIISKKVKCRKADSRSESPTCKSCKSELPSSGGRQRMK
uniref:FXYD domain-containing ion transport regulator n=2 Tax=Suricata suricatta TaxID=37032 RepID=A0A673V0T2_SURSU